MAEADDKKGFTIRDRRSTSQSEEPKGEPSGAKMDPQKAEDFSQKAPSPPLPEVDFSSFIFSLSTSALMHLGELPDPVTQNREKDLPLAKQTIDILGMLREKTKGNLGPEESNLLETILADLRWRYIREAKG
jgi:hypothetical protein